MSFTLYYKVLFMSDKNQHLETLKDIKMIMEKSSRFISLSGLSGIAAGICALVGVYLVTQKIQCWKIGECLFERLMKEGDDDLLNQLYLIAAGTFLAAFISAFFFTWLRSRKNNIPIWGSAARRLLWSVSMPLLVGAIFLFRMIQFQHYELVAPGTLIFYGLALVNASRFTFKEIRYLGYAEILLGLVNCWMVGYGLHFWAAGFGVLHIVYGINMWYKYERINSTPQV